MAECQLPKLDVAGSTPVSRSIIRSYHRETLFPSGSVSTPSAYATTTTGRSAGGWFLLENQAFNSRTMSNWRM